MTTVSADDRPIPASTDLTDASSTCDWPLFELLYVFGPDIPDSPFEFDELVVYDPTDGFDDRWITAKEGSYVEIADVR